MTAQIIPLRRPQKAGEIDLDLLEANLRAIFPEKISEFGAHRVLLNLARDELAAEGVVLKGHKSAIDALLRYKLNEIRFELSLSDDRIDALMLDTLPGRPNRYSALRDLLIFSQCLTTFNVLKVRQPVSIREARKLTAKLFNLTSDTREKRSRSWSIEQVQRADERTVARLRALDRYLGIKGVWHTAYTASMAAIGLHIAELRGDVSDELRASMKAEAAKLLLLCRLLALASHLDRVRRAGRSKPN